MPHIILIGTLDSKLQAFSYLHAQLLEAAAAASSTPLQITLIDCGRSNTNHHPLITISHADLVTRYGPNEPRDLQTIQRGEVIKHMTLCATACIQDLIANTEIHGIISAGGSGGTSLVSAVMRDAAPLGMPKLIVSTVASGDTGPIVAECDITMMYSVVDIAGMNGMLRAVLSNAAGAMLGMSAAYERSLERARRRKNSEESREDVTRVGITMFGVTTPCVEQIVKHLDAKYSVEVFVFHATGHGGKAMERMIREGRLDAILDLTTTEICDHLFGGNMSAGPNRLEAALEAGIPNIVSIGATDMVNFGPMEMVPSGYKERLLLEHNPVVTLMRTTKEECEEVAKFILEKIQKYATRSEMVEVWLPHEGVSVISTPGAVFADLEAEKALVETVAEGLQGSGVKVVKDSRHINEEGFANDIADSLMTMVSRREQCSIHP